jgi:hypothetical protein
VSPDIIATTGTIELAIRNHVLEEREHHKNQAEDGYRDHLDDLQGIPDQFFPSENVPAPQKAVRAVATGRQILDECTSPVLVNAAPLRC